MTILGEHLPAAVNHILLQADLTAVAPGYLAPELSETLLLMADAEGQGPASIYRFSAASIRRALDAGQDAESLLAFLREHSATDVPQPLGVPRPGHGVPARPAPGWHQLPASSRATTKRHHRTAQRGPYVRLEPGAYRPHCPDILTPAPGKLPGCCASWDFRPAVQEAEPAVVRFKRTTAVPGSARPVYTAPRTAPPEEDVDAQLSVLAPAPRSAVRKRPAATRRGSHPARPGDPAERPSGSSRPSP